MRLGYADPPYPGCAHLYRNHQDYAGEVDHADLVARLDSEYDGWVLHTSSVALPQIAPLVVGTSARVCSWVKPFAAFKRNVPVAYAWEPVLVKAARKPVVSGRQRPLRDWFAESITLKRGLTGAKPERLCHWIFEVLGAHPDDVLDDIFPGTESVSKAWGSWRKKFLLPVGEDE